MPRKASKEPSTRYASVLRWLLDGGADGREHTIAQAMRGTGLARSYFDQALQGRVGFPGIDKAAALADYFQISVNDLTRLILNPSLPLPSPPGATRLHRPGREAPTRTERLIGYVNEHLSLFKLVPIPEYAASGLNKIRLGLAWPHGGDHIVLIQRVDLRHFMRMLERAWKYRTSGVAVGLQGYEVLNSPWLERRRQALVGSFCPETQGVLVPAGLETDLRSIVEWERDEQSGSLPQKYVGDQRAVEALRNTDEDLRPAVSLLVYGGAIWFPPKQLIADAAITVRQYERALAWAQLLADRLAKEDSPQDDELERQLDMLVHTRRAELRELAPYRDSSGHEAATVSTGGDGLEDDTQVSVEALRRDLLLGLGRMQIEVAGLTRLGVIGSQHASKLIGRIEFETGRATHLDRSGLRGLRASLLGNPDLQSCYEGLGIIEIAGHTTAAVAGVSDLDLLNREEDLTRTWRVLSAERRDKLAAGAEPAIESPNDIVRYGRERPRC